MSVADPLWGVAEIGIAIVLVGWFWPVLSAAGRV